MQIKKYIEGNVEVNGKEYYSCGVRIKREPKVRFAYVIGALVRKTRSSVYNDLCKA